MDRAKVDGRRARGDATRRVVARRAAHIATVSGLDSITVGGLASDTGVSKSGILTVFESREAIQLAAVAEARELYLQAVIRPAFAAERGLPRLRALLDAWRTYLLDGVFPGGCFIAATTAEYGHRDGPVAQAVRALKQEWLELLEAELLAAGSPDPGTDAFRIDAFLVAGNQRRELFGHDQALAVAYHLVSGILDDIAEAPPNSGR